MNFIYLEKRIRSQQHQNIPFLISGQKKREEIPLSCKHELLITLPLAALITY